MSVPIFVDLQGFFVGRQFAALKEGHVLSHYIFVCPYSSFFNLKDIRRCGWL